jgi:hypothetical protein
MAAGTALLILALSGAAASPPDQLALARRLYNQGQLEQALVAAHEAEGNPAEVSSARLVIGRIRLERYRRTADSTDLSDGRVALRSIDPRALTPRERIELQVGFSELLYIDGHFGAAADFLEPILDDTAMLGAQAHERALDWWATALDRDAQRMDMDDRGPVYERIARRMDRELQRDPGSTPANYWTAAAARGAGANAGAMSAARAARVRGALTSDQGAALRADLDRLVTRAIIPDLAAQLETHDKNGEIAAMMAEWERFKGAWTR